MSQFNAPAYDIDRPTGACAITGQTLMPGEPYMATLVEVEESSQGSTAGLGLRRLDVSWAAWQEGKRPPGLFSFWKSTVPQSNQKKKLFVDDDVLMNLFRRLGDSDQPERLAFRFVLALILMRKRLLKYEGSRRRQGSQGAEEWWRVIPRGEQEPLEVLNPHLDEQRIAQVTEQLSQILEAEL